MDRKTFLSALTIPLLLVAPAIGYCENSQYQYRKQQFTGRLLKKGSMPAFYYILQEQDSSQQIEITGLSDDQMNKYQRKIVNIEGNYLRKIGLMGEQLFQISDIIEIR